MLKRKLFIFYFKHNGSTILSQMKNHQHVSVGGSENLL